MQFTETYKNHLNIFSIIFIAIVLILFIIKSIYFPLSDFANYYFGSKFFLEGKSLIDIYEGYRFNQMIFEAGYENVFVNYTPLPPITLLFFIPFTVFEVGLAKIIFNVLSAALFLFVLVYAFRRYAIDFKYLVLILILFFSPILNNFSFGQVYLLLFSFMVLGFILYEDGYKKWASVFWGFAILLKIFPALILIYLLQKKEWKQIIYLITFCVIMLLVSVIVVGHSVWLQYIFSVLPRLMQGEFHDTFTPHFQSMFVLLKNIFIADTISNPNPIFESEILFNVFFILFKGIMLSIATFITLKTKTTGILKFSIWMVMGLMIAPYGSTYGLLMLIIFYIAFIQDYQHDKLKLILMSLILLIISNLPVQKFLSLTLFMQYPRLYVMLFLIIIIVLFYRVKIKLKYLIPFIALFVLSMRIGSSKSDYYSTTVKELMIYDYTVLDDQLTYKFWIDNGEQIKTISINDSIWFDESLALNQNQIYYDGNQITDSDDRKLKPMRLGDEEIVCLSDKNRGVGFYTFRKINLIAQKNHQQN
jgi:glycosyl transferase family 87